MIYFYKKAYKKDSYRKFLYESYHYDHPVLVQLPSQHHVNFEKPAITAKGHFLCKLFFVPVR